MNSYSVYLVTFLLTTSSAYPYPAGSGSLSPDGSGGYNLNLNAEKSVGNAAENVVGSVGAMLNSKTGLQSTDARLDYNNNGYNLNLANSNTPGVQNTAKLGGNANIFDTGANKLDASAFGSHTSLSGGDSFNKYGAGLKLNNADGHSASLSHIVVPNQFKQTDIAGKLNLFNNDRHNVDANAFNQHTKLNNGFDFNKYGGSLDYNHAKGHGLSFGFDKIPKADTTNVFAQGNANLWRSPDRMTSFDLTGSATRTFTPFSSGKTNFGAGLGLTHMFG